MFVRHTQLFLWKNSLQKARNPGQTCCELLTPVVLVALFALLCVTAARRAPRAARRRAAQRGAGGRATLRAPAPPPTPAQVQVCQPE